MDIVAVNLTLFHLPAFETYANGLIFFLCCRCFVFPHPVPLCVFKLMNDMLNCEQIKCCTQCPEFFLTHCSRLQELFSVASLV